MIMNDNFGSMWKEIVMVYFKDVGLHKRMAVAARSKARIVFAHTNNGIVGSNPTRGMDVCEHLFCLCVFPCVGSGLATVWSPVQGVLLTVYKLRDWKRGQDPQGL
jgi:hypothetical protein